MLLSGIHFIINYLLYIGIRMDNILKFIYVSHLLCFAYCELWPMVWPIRLVIYCRSNYGVEFYLAKLLIRSRNQGVECGSNPGSDSRWPNLMTILPTTYYVYHLFISLKLHINICILSIVYVLRLLLANGKPK